MSKAKNTVEQTATPTKPIFEFQDYRLMPLLLGEHDRFLKRIEQLLQVVVKSRGNQIMIEGDERNTKAAMKAFRHLYHRLEKGFPIDIGEVDAAIKLASWHDPLNSPDPNTDDLTAQTVSLHTKKKTVIARTPAQKKYVHAMKSHDLVFGVGPAGTGKTYLAVAMGVSLLIRGVVTRMILSRPAVEAGERLGFLPGDLKDKVDPYLRPLYDSLYDLLPGNEVSRRMEAGDIEIAPLAYMRGRTLSNAYIILDEAQNATPVQMKMFLTRLGENSRMVVTGDMTQIDLPAGTPSGLSDAVNTLKGIEGIECVQFSIADIVRNPLVSKIVDAYERKKKV